MPYLLWLSGAAAAAVLAIWFYGHRIFPGEDMGTISEQWLHNHRRETHEPR